MSFDALKHLYIYAVPLSNEQMDHFGRQSTWTLHEALHFSVGLDPMINDKSVAEAEACSNGDRILANWKTIKNDIADEEVSYRLMNNTPPDVTPANRFRYIMFDSVDFVRYASKFLKFPARLTEIVLSRQEKVISKHERPANAMLNIKNAAKNEHKAFIRSFVKDQLAQPKCTCDNASMKQYIEMRAADRNGKLLYDDELFSVAKLQEEVTALFVEKGLSTRIKGLKGYKKPKPCSEHPLA